MPCQLPHGSAHGEPCSILLVSFARQCLSIGHVSAGATFDGDGAGLNESADVRCPDRMSCSCCAPMPLNAEPPNLWMHTLDPFGGTMPCSQTCNPPFGAPLRMLGRDKGLSCEARTFGIIHELTPATDTARKAFHTL